MLRKFLWPILVLALTACGASPIIINVQSGSPPTPTVAVQVAYQPAQDPSVVYLPTPGATPTPLPASTIWLASATVAPTLAASTGSAPAGFGQTVNAWGWQMRCVGSEGAPERLVWSAEGNQLLAVGSWAIVALEMTNTQPTPQTVRGADFVVRDAQLRTFKATGALGESDYSAFRGGERLGAPVVPGATARFYLVFDVARDARGLRLIFTGPRPASDRFEASFDLGH